MFQSAVRIAVWLKCGMVTPLSGIVYVSIRRADRCLVEVIAFLGLNVFPYQFQSAVRIAVWLKVVFVLSLRFGPRFQSAVRIAVWLKACR